VVIYLTGWIYGAPGHGIYVQLLTTVHTSLTHSRPGHGAFSCYLHTGWTYMALRVFFAIFAETSFLSTHLPTCLSTHLPTCLSILHRVPLLLINMVNLHVTCLYFDYFDRSPALLPCLLRFYISTCLPTSTYCTCIYPHRAGAYLQDVPCFLFSHRGICSPNSSATVRPIIGMGCRNSNFSFF
jgi:hypothetical protein